MRSLLAAAVFLCLSPAIAHDYYAKYYDKAGRWCCSGNLEGTMGDCSPAEVKMNADGSAFMQPVQYPDVWILVPAHRIMPDGPPDPEARRLPAHWCGKPRPEYLLPTADDPDPKFTTICASIFPGGS